LRTVGACEPEDPGLPGNGVLEESLRPGMMLAAPCGAASLRASDRFVWRGAPIACGSPRS
jgi:hypothetical protein